MKGACEHENYIKRFDLIDKRITELPKQITEQIVKRIGNIEAYKSEEKINIKEE